MNDQIKRPILKLLVAIVDADKAHKVTDIVKRTHVALHYQFRAEGTANSEMADYLGLGSTDKVVTMCLAPHFITRKLITEVANEMHMATSGKGIVFTLPLSGASSFILKMADEDVYKNIQNHIESEVEKMKSESTHDLIIAVINQGYSEEVMEAAKEAGAFGGTVIHARRVGLEETMKFWGISVQPEKEIIGIIVQRDKKVAIMKAICQVAGMNTEAHGISFSLPVDSVMGLKTEE